MKFFMIAIFILSFVGCNNNDEAPPETDEENVAEELNQNESFALQESQPITECLSTLTGSYTGEGQVHNSDSHSTFQLEVNGGNNEDGIQELIFLMTLTSEETETQHVCTVIMSPDLNTHVENAARSEGEAEGEELTEILGSYFFYNSVRGRLITQVELSNNCTVGRLNNEGFFTRRLRRPPIEQVEKSGENVRSYTDLKEACTSLNGPFN